MRRRSSSESSTREAPGRAAEQDRGDQAEEHGSNRSHPHVFSGGNHHFTPAPPAPLWFVVLDPRCYREHVPELPEVEYTRRRLRAAMEGARIERVLTRRANLRYPFAPDFVQRLEGQQVRRVTRRAKYLLVETSSGDVLLMHLGMSGSFRMAGGKGPPYDGSSLDAHDHVIFEMSNGSVVVFNDPRRFGFMTLLTPRQLPGHPALSRLGPEPLARGFGAAALAATLARRKTSLKLALADQRLVAGLGNIYVSEALHLARLSPKRRASTLVTRSGQPRPELHVLVSAIREVLKKAIKNQYRTGGEDPFLVYGRKGERCPRRACGGVIRRIVQGGRSTFFCPACQR
jgi:formamidopyrimidine-DNA glycosylase